MNIILLTSARDTSGGTRQALYLAQEFIKAGHIVSFFTYPDSALRALDPSVAWKDLPEGWINSERALRDAVVEMSSAKETPGPVVLHAFHNKGVKMAAYFGTWWRILRLPVTCVAHRGVIYRPYNVFPYLLPGVRAFIVNSQACADTLPLLWRKKRAIVVYNSIPPERLIPGKTLQQTLDSIEITALANENTPFIIGTVANDKPNKGVESLIKAFALLMGHIARGTVQEDNLPYLLLVGVNPKWMKLCEELGIAGRIRLVGRTEQVSDFLQVMSIFVLPSFLESQPNTLLEAMGMGLAAIGSRTGGIPELLENRDKVLFVPGNSEEISNRLHALWNDRLFLSNESEANLKKSKEFIPEYRIERILSIYKNVLQELL